MCFIMDNDNHKKITDAAEQGFIKMASVGILQSLLTLNDQKNNNVLISKSVNLAYQLNDELNKRFSNQ